jgi:hypothetical protein
METMAAGMRPAGIRGAASRERPRLRHCTLLAHDRDGPLTVIVGRDHYQIEADVGSRDTLLHVKSLLDGRHSVAAISDLTRVPQSQVAALVAQLEELGLLRREEPVETLPTDAFVERLEASLVMWKRQIGFHPLFQLLYRGDARREVFQGLVLETYHYVRSARRHVSVALAHNSNPFWEDLLADYFAEEYDHGPLVLETLERLGIPQDVARDAHPTIGTLSLINMLCEVGRHSTLAYLACTTLFEARREDAQPAAESFRRLARRYGFEPNAVEPLLSHLTGDVEAGHTSLLREAVAGRQHVTADEAHQVVNALHDVKHSFDQFHEGILAYYSDISNYIPRLKVDYFSL